MTLLLLLSVVAGDPAQIILEESALVASRSFSLGDIATIETNDREQRRRLEGISLGEGPRPDNPRIISRAGLGSWLVGRGCPHGSFTIKGAKSCVVSLDTVPLSSAEILEQVLEEMRSRQTSDFRVEFRAKTRPPEVQLPKAVRVPEIIVGPGDRRIRVKVLGDGEVIESFVVLFDVAKFAVVPVVLRPIERGEPIEASDVEFREMEISTTRSRPLTEDTLHDRVATRALREGDVVREDNSKVPPVIRRGEPVDLIVRIGSLEVTAKGVAKQDGALGQEVRIINQQTKRQLKGVVLGPGRVLVQERKRG